MGFPFGSQNGENPTEKCFQNCGVLEHPIFLFFLVDVGSWLWFLLRALDETSLGGEFILFTYEVDVICSWLMLGCGNQRW